MRPGREIDTQVAQEIFGHEVYAKNKVLHEKTPEGERPLRFYTRDIEYAWPVAEKMRVTLIPIEGGQWFAFIGAQQGWTSPTALMEFLQGDQFAGCGAAVGENAALVICSAALKAIEKRQTAETNISVDDLVPISEERH